MKPFTMCPVLKPLIISTLLLQTTITSTSNPQCRCLPSDPCWPTPTDWSSLNHTLGGKLLAVHPVGSVCHDPTYDAAACADAAANWASSSWRGDRPGGMVGVNWEITRNETCYITSPRNSACLQGRVPIYAIAATTPEDIQTGVNFAQTHNLRLSIKNTGHDFLGRSAARGSLQIWTHAMKCIQLTDDFRPAGCEADKKGESAVTICAGVQLRELYKAAMEGGRTFVAGFASTVGAAGGFVQGGGHSAFGPWKGMGSDNALEFRVVVADGSHVTANEYQNTDLYWALRGGGGGTFGVVTSVTLRTFPDVPMVIALYNFTAPAPEYYTFLTSFYEHLPAISDAGGSGYHFMFNDPPQPFFKLTNFFLNQTNTSAVSSVYAPLVSAHKSDTSQTVFQTHLLPSAAEFMYTRLTGTELAGYHAVLGSRLISRSFISSETGPSQLVKVLRTLAPNQASAFTGHQVAGGQVARNTHIDSALNPAWRRALMHLTFHRGWYDDTPVSAQEAIARNLTVLEMGMVKGLEPDMGAYLNEADPGEEEWQRSFWGEGYGRLVEVKGRWDPGDLFMCYPCVGAEGWDREGICRV